MAAFEVAEVADVVGWLVRAGDYKGFFAGARPLAATNLFVKLEESARRARKELGLSPLAEVQLEKLKRETVAVGTSLEELRERGRKARSKR